MSLLTVVLNGDEVAAVEPGDLPCELTPSRAIDTNSTLEFIESTGRRHVHSLGELSGWAHISVRLNERLGCQADCLVTDDEIFDAGAHKASAPGVRFQPFFLPEAMVDAQRLVGQGLFARGLHFNGLVTPGSVRLSCECDFCFRTFQVQSFHAGFANLGYMYSDSGAYTLTIADDVPGCPPALGTPDMAALERLEAILPLAPDGTTFRYAHPFRCPHCRKPYIDFEAHPGLREREYYGNCLFGVPPIRYLAPSAIPDRPAKRLSHRMALDWKGLVFGLALPAAGIGITASVATGQQDASEEAGEAAAWPEAAGRVTRNWIEEGTTAGNMGRRYPTYTPRVAYSYEVDGSLYLNDRLSLSQSRQQSSRGAAEDSLRAYAVGAPVTVRYDPQSPRRSALIIEDAGSVSYIGLAMGGLLTIFGGYLVAMTLRPRRPSSPPDAGRDGPAADPPDRKPPISSVRFEPEFVSQNPPFALGRNLETGKPVFAIPVRNRMVEYEEWYSISEEEMKALLKDFDLAAG